MRLFTSRNRSILFFASLIVVIGITFLSITIISSLDKNPTGPEDPLFNGERAFQDVKYQLALGARTPGSQAHQEVITWLTQQLEASNFSVDIQESIVMDHSINNVVARWGEGQPWVLIGAHYDSRIFANKDPHPGHEVLPVPGANDGASGVAVLLELSRNISLLSKQRNNDARFPDQIWLVFFDAEDNGKLPGWDWILGSKAFVTGLGEYPEAVIIVDMVGDIDLQICQELNSRPELMLSIWETARNLGFTEEFSNDCQNRILDDHVPFVNLGIPAVDIIDINYPYYHTLEDTSDKVSTRSLEVVGTTLLTWLLNYHWQKW